MIEICMAVFLLASSRAEIYNTRMRRSIWISTPSGIQYQSHIIPSHNVNSQVFIPYQREMTDDVDQEYMSPTKYRQGTRIDKSDYRDNEGRVETKQRSGLEKFKSGLYDALFGGGIARIFVYIIVAGLFAIIGYQIRKQEEYGSYVRLPAEEG